MFRCLKAHKAELDPACAKVVGFRQIEQAADISLDTPLALSCEEDRKSLCADAPWGGGAVEQCLKDNRSELSTQCKLEVFRREVEESEDVRYDAFLAETCAADKSAFCGDVVPGEGRIMACLEAHAGAAKFSAECRSILDRRVVRRAADWRLDFALRKACAKTAKSMCAPELEAARSKVSSSGTVLECLKRKHADGDVDDAPCAAEIKKKMVAAAGDIREDTALTLACKAELTKHCDGVAPGEGRLWRCSRSTARTPLMCARRNFSSARCGCPATGGSSTRSPTSARRRRRRCVRASPRAADASSGACSPSWVTRRWAPRAEKRSSRTRSASTPTCVCIRRSRRRAARTRARCAATSRPAKGACWRASNASARR